MIHSLRTALERAYWWLAGRVFGVRLLGDIAFVYVSADEGRTAADVETILTRALGLISTAKGGFGELVTSHLKFVGAVSGRPPYISTNMRGYISRFRGPEATSETYLACELVWAATYIRLSRDAAALNTPPNKEQIRKAAYEAQLRFVRQFPDADEWVGFLAENRPEVR